MLPYKLTEKPLFIFNFRGFHKQLFKYLSKIERTFSVFTSRKGKVYFFTANFNLPPSSNWFLTK